MSDVREAEDVVVDPTDERVRAMHLALHEALEIGASGHCIGEDCMHFKRSITALTALYNCGYAVIDLWSVT